MTSAGGLVPVADGAPTSPAALLLSGPGRRRAGRGRDRRGVRVPRRGQLRHGRDEHRRVPRPGRRARAGARTRSSPGYPIRLPALDVHTIGAGGGSIARLDAGGALVVGPRERGRRARTRVLRARRRRSRRSPTPTSCSAASRPTRRSRTSGGSTLAARTGALERGRRRPPTGVVAVVDAAMEQRGARGRRSSAASTRASSRSSRSVAPGPLHACAIADALGMRAVIVPPRAGVFGRRPAGVAHAARERRALRWPRPATHRRRRTRGTCEPRSRDARRCTMRRRRDRRRLPLRRAEPRAHGRVAGRFPAEHERRNGSRPPGRAGRGRRVRAGPGDSSPRRSHRGLPGAGAPAVGRGPRSSPNPTARCGSRTVGRPSPARSAPGSLRTGRAVTLDPGDAAGADLAARAASPTRWARCCAAPRTARTSRSGPTARPRCSPPTASCSRRPSTSRCTSGRCRRRCAPRSTRARAELGPGDQIVVNDPFAGGTHLNDITFVAPVFVADGRWSAGSRTVPTTPTSAAWRPARCRPTRPRSTQEGLRIPPVRCTRRRRGARRRRIAHARRAARRSRRAARRQRGRRRRGSPPLAGVPLSTRSSTTASAACAPRCAALPDGG